MKKKGVQINFKRFEKILAIVLILVTLIIFLSFVTGVSRGL